MFMVAGAALLISPFLVLMEIAQAFREMQALLNAGNDSSDTAQAGAVATAISFEAVLFLWSIAGAILFFARKRAARVVLSAFFGVRLLFCLLAIAAQPALYGYWLAVAWNGGLLAYFAFGYQRGAPTAAA